MSTPRNLGPRDNDAREDGVVQLAPGDRAKTRYYIPFSATKVENLPDVQTSPDGDADAGRRNPVDEEFVIMGLSYSEENTRSEAETLDWQIQHSPTSSSHWDQGPGII